MRYKQILKHFQDELEHEIANEKSLPRFYKGLKVAREMLQKQINIQEEIEHGYEGEENE